MRLSYGGYLHPAGEVMVGIQRRTLATEGHFAKGYTESWTIDGFLQAADQASITAAIAVLQTAYAKEGKDLILLQDSGAASAHLLLSANTLGGVRIVEPVSFPNGRGAEYATYRTYRIVLEVDVIAPGVGIIAWTERIKLSGGPPRLVALQPLKGLPQIQTVATNTPYRMTQDGSAVGQTTWPAPNPPIIGSSPPLQGDATSIEPGSPKRWGPPGSPVYAEFPISWHYEFISATPINAKPTLWRP